MDGKRFERGMLLGMGFGCLFVALVVALRFGALGG